jgi:carboxyl-terminal processing protease
MVLAPIKGSPAERAGIQPGDEVVTVDGTSTVGWDGEAAARVLRGEQGSSVTVEVARRREAVPGVAGLVDPSASGRNSVETKRFRLRRETVELSPIFATAVNYDDHMFGYIRLTTFSQHAAEDMRRAMAQLKRDGVEAFMLDLRNNPGGLVTSALEVASLWLDGATQPTIFSVQDRPSFEPAEAGLINASLPREVESVDTSQRVVLSGTRPATKMPLAVLVNRQSASASEILAGALHDNARAEIIGGA